MYLKNGHLETKKTYGLMLLHDEAKIWLMTKNIKIHGIYEHVQHHRAISVCKAQILKNNQNKS